jgi:hypothetical protein
MKAMTLLPVLFPDARFEVICGLPERWSAKPIPDPALFIADRLRVAPAPCLLMLTSAVDLVAYFQQLPTRRICEPS